MRSVLATTLFVVLCVAAFFYLFVFPVLVASQTFPPEVGVLLFAGFLYLQLWMLVMAFTYEATSAIYEFQIKLPKLLRILLWHSDKPLPISRGRIIFLCTISYLLTIYGFAVLYVFLSYNTSGAFSTGKLSIFNAVYFSITTIATVGYGDITPLSVAAKTAVMAEILTGILYVVFLFSLLADFVRRKPEN